MKIEFDRNVKSFRDGVLSFPEFVAPRTEFPWHSEIHIDDAGFSLDCSRGETVNGERLAARVSVPTCVMGGCASKPPVGVRENEQESAQGVMETRAKGVCQTERTDSGDLGANRGGGVESSFRGVSGATQPRGSAGCPESIHSGENRGSGGVGASIGRIRRVGVVSEEEHGARVVADAVGGEGGEGGCVENQVVLKTADGTAGAFACAGVVELKAESRKMTSEVLAATETVTVTTTQLSLSRPLPVCSRYAQMTALLSTMLSCDLVEVKFTTDELQWQVSVAEQLGTLAVDGRLLEASFGTAMEEVVGGRKLCPLSMLRPEDDVLVIPDLQLNEEYKDHPCVVGGPQVRLFAAAWLTSSDDPGSSRRQRRSLDGPERRPDDDGRSYGVLYLADKAPRDPKHVKEIEEVLKEAAKVVTMSIDEYKLDVIKEILVLDRKRRLSAESARAGTMAFSTEQRTSVGEGKTTWGSDDGTFISAGDSISRMISAVDCFQDGCMLLECIVGSKFAVGWNVVHVNDSLSRQLGCDTKSMIGKGFWEYYLTDITERSSTNSLVRENRPFELSATFQNTLHPDPVVHVLEFRPAVAVGNSGNVSSPDDESLSPSRQASRNSSMFQQSNSSRSMQGDGASAEAGSLTGLWPGNETSSLLTTLSLAEKEQIEQIEPSYSVRGGPGSRTSGEVKRYYFAHLNADSVGAIGSRSRPLQLSKEAPRVFKDIRLGPLIGRGAYGRVYRGNWNGNIVAVKVITSEQLMEKRIKETAGGSKRPDAEGLHEAVLSSALSHPNVLHTYQYSFRNVPVSRVERSRDHSGRREDDDGETQAAESTRHATGSNPESSGQLISELWLVSEFCNRGPLLTAIENGLFMIHASNASGGNGSLPESQTNLIYILQTAQEISAAMEYLHGHDVVHGDLTGGNVLLQTSDKDGRGFTAKVVDFGLSRVCAGGSLKTSKMGCAEYMPPELISRGLLTKAGDVYAFGVILWELYMGKRAWASVKPPDVLDRVAKGISLEYPSHTPRRLKVLGERCLSISMEARPHFADIVHEVNTILDDTMAILRSFLGNSANSNSTGQNHQGTTNIL